MIRIPGEGRFELRLMDGAVNPYLMQAGIIAAGLDGINKKRNPGSPVFLNMYEESHKVKDLKKLPLSINESLDQLEKNIVLNKSFGKEVIKSYITLKNRELKNYKDQEGSIKNDLITEWEKINTLDC